MVPREKKVYVSVFAALYDPERTRYSKVSMGRATSRNSPQDWDEICQGAFPQKNTLTEFFKK